MRNILTSLADYQNDATNSSLQKEQITYIDNPEATCCTFYYAPRSRVSTLVKIEENEINEELEKINTIVDNLITMIGQISKLEQETKETQDNVTMFSSVDSYSTMLQNKYLNIVNDYNKEKTNLCNLREENLVIGMIPTKKKKDKPESITSKKGKDILESLYFLKMPLDVTQALYNDALFELKYEIQKIEDSLQNNPNYDQEQKSVFVKSVKDHLTVLKNDVDVQKKTSSWQHRAVTSSELKHEQRKNQDIEQSPAIQLAKKTTKMLKTLTFHDKEKDTQTLMEFYKNHRMTFADKLINFTKSVAAITAAGIGLIYGAIVGTCCGSVLGYIIGTPIYTYFGARNKSVSAKDHVKEVTGLQPHDSLLDMLFFKPSKLSNSAVNMAKEVIKSIDPDNTFIESEEKQERDESFRTESLASYRSMIP